MSLVDPELAGRAIERALRRGGDLAEVYVEERHGFAVTLDDGRVERPQTGSERGASIRMVAGEASRCAMRSLTVAKGRSLRRSRMSRCRRDSLISERSR